MGGAVITSGFLNMMLTHSGIAPVSDMTGLMEFAGIWKKRERVYGTPSYYAFQLYSTADIDHLVGWENNGGTYLVREGISRLPEIEHVPYLDVVAATNKDNSTLTLFCVNRHLTKDFDSAIDLSGFAGAKAQVKTLSAPDIYMENDETEPERVMPRQATLTGQGDKWRYTFPHESVTRIEVTKQ